jgi:hypothetical protein
MKAYVITIADNPYSESCALRCIESAAMFRIEVEPFPATGKEDAMAELGRQGLQWNWPSRVAIPCRASGLTMHPYRTSDVRARIGCALSHYRLWKMALSEPLLILEHDAVFLRALPREAFPEDADAIMLNDPAGATPKGKWWSEYLTAKGPGIHRKTQVLVDGRPDGLAGNSAYVITPKGAQRVLAAIERTGLWPNDATLCRQLVPDLYEVFPFVTVARQQQSTSGGY